MKINLYDYVTFHHKDYDTYDTDWDCIVTVCEPSDEPEDNYDYFCIELMKHVDVVKTAVDGLVVNWSELIEKNFDSFKEFTKRHWREDCQYKDDRDEFIFQWIIEIHYYLAGYTDEETYGELLKLVKTCK